jgi:hypothetical protein
MQAAYSLFPTSDENLLVSFRISGHLRENKTKSPAKMKTPGITLPLLTVLFLTITAEVVAAFTQNQASKLPTRTASSQPQQSFHLQPRSTSTAVVDFDSLASVTCAFSQCAHPSAGTVSVSPPCKAIPTPCPAATADGDNCSTFPLECYCQQATPLYCAWPCSWYQWFLAEDWFKTQCPDVKPIDFDSAPKCARQCLSINFGCISSTRNCFCIQGSLFGCEKQCKGTVALQQSLVDWYQDQCLVNESEAEYDIGVSATRNVTASLFKSPHPLHWYEITAVTLASLSAVIFGWIIIMNGFLRDSWDDSGQVTLTGNLRDASGQSTSTG